jgi:glycine/D-amino acid oxidase-like deaminating enzyme/nitrite reductase/ring-hydroxylating ferredoxin subunit
MSAATRPLWADTSNTVTFPVLERPLRADAVVVGAGVTGITAAYLLARAGRRVVLLERGRVLERDTAHTTAHLTCVADSRLTTLVERLGRDHAAAVWDAGLAAIAAIDEHVRTEDIPCGFAWVPGYLHVPPGSAAGDRDAEGLHAEASLARELGFDAEFVERAPLVGTPAMAVAGQARIHPLRYLSGLLAAAVERGCLVFERSGVDDVTDAPSGVVANGVRVDCDYVVVATHNPIVGRASVARATLLQTTLALYTSYVVAGRVPRAAVPDALFWDTADPYRYLRIERGDGHDVVVFGGEDHKTGQAGDPLARFDRLEASLRALVPDAEMSHRWSAQVIETPDGLPCMGETAPGQFVATGFAGNGMTFGTLGGMMAADAALGRTNPWQPLFDVDRTKLRGGVWDYLRENKDYPYYMIRDRFAGAEGRTLRAVPRGEGRILDLDGRRVAAYRASNGDVTLRSPICTHMGCTVGWNAAGRSWDCPCHGSRFSPTGEVIAGPAESPLSPVSGVEHAEPR